jgi:hypothetical protein
MCVFRAGGVNFDVDAFLAASSLEAISIRRKGEFRFLTKPDGPRHGRSGFTADVSVKEWSDLPGQIEDAKAFLTEHRTELRRLRSFPGVEILELDFPMNLRIGTNRIVVQSDRLPADLLLTAGGGGVDIVITNYPPSTDGESSPAPEPPEVAE